MLRYLAFFIAFSPIALASPPEGMWANSLTEIEILEHEVRVARISYPFGKEVVVESRAVSSSDFLSNALSYFCVTTTRIAAKKGESVVLLEATRSRPTSFLGAFLCGRTPAYEIVMLDPYAYTQMVLSADPSDKNKLLVQTLSVADFMERPVLSVEHLLEPSLASRFENHPPYVEISSTSLNSAVKR